MHLEVVFATRRHVVHTFVVVWDGKPLQGHIIPLERVQCRFDLKGIS